jgi:hypothetical protein
MMMSEIRYWSLAAFAAVVAGRRPVRGAYHERRPQAAQPFTQTRLAGNMKARFDRRRVR